MILEDGGYCDFEQGVGNGTEKCGEPSIAMAGKKHLCAEHAKYYAGMTGEPVFFKFPSGLVHVTVKDFLNYIKEAENE